MWLSNQTYYKYTIKTAHHSLFGDKWTTPIIGIFFWSGAIIKQHWNSSPAKMCPKKCLVCNYREIGRVITGMHCPILMNDT